MTFNRDEEGKVEALIQGLGAETHAEREEAEEMLGDQPRPALPILGAHSESPDPEVRERVRNIIAHIQNDPAKIPQAIWRLDWVSIDSCPGNSRHRQRCLCHFPVNELKQ